MYLLPVDTLHKKLRVHGLIESYIQSVFADPIILLFNLLHMKPKIFRFDETIYNLHSLCGSSSWSLILLIRNPRALLTHLHLMKQRFDILDVFKLLLFSAYVQVMYIFQVVVAVHHLQKQILYLPHLVFSSYLHHIVRIPSIPYIIYLIFLAP